MNEPQVAISNVHNITFKSYFSVIGQMPYFHEQEIKREPMLFSADLAFAREHGGDITRTFLDLCSDEVQGQPAILDSRVHMLMPGWYPCIPGWHVDDVPRTRPDGQPEHINPDYKAQHICAICGSASLTQFIRGCVTLKDVPIYGGVVYGKWNGDINRMIASGELSTEQLDEGNICAFDWQSFHRGMPATKGGWRLFIRISWNTQREIKNEVRQQTQIYLPAHEAGW